MAKAEYKSAKRSRRLINDALADLLMEKPLEKITVTDVVARADLNRGTFYAHYRDIPDVLEHLIQQTFSAIREALTSPAEPGADVGHVLLMTIQEILEADLEFYRKILNSSAASLMQEQLVRIGLDFMLEHQAKFFNASQLEHEMAIRFCAGGLSNLYRDWFTGKIRCSLSELTAIGEGLLRRTIADSV